MSGYGEHPPGGHGGPAQDPYGQYPYGQDPYAPDPYAADPYAAGAHAPDAYAPDAYGQYPHGQDPAGQYAFGQNWYPGGPYGHDPMAAGYGPPGFGQAPARTGPAVAALICNGLLFFTCYGVFAAPGIITAALAANRAQSDPQSSRRLTAWSWGIFGASLLIAILIVVGVVVYGYNSGSDSYDGIY